MTISFRMNPNSTIFYAIIAGLFVLPAVARPASADNDVPAGDSKLLAADAGAASIVERKLMDIANDEAKLFSDMESGQLSQDDFERKALAVSYRYNEILARNQNDLETLVLYGKFLRRVGKNDAANVYFAHADHIAPDVAVVKQQLGNFLAEEGNYSEAMKYYLKAIDLAPNEAVYHYGMGELIATFRDKFIADGTFAEKEADDKASAEFGKAAQLDPKNKDFAFRRGEAYYDVADPDWNAALALWTEMAKRTDLTPYERDAVRLHTARVYCELRRGKEARELLVADVVPILRATKARLLKRLSMETTPAEDKANAEIMAPSKPDGADVGRK
jgi:tetratricopeptide (TPR) repeat protein